MIIIKKKSAFIISRNTSVQNQKANLTIEQPNLKFLLNNHCFWFVSLE